jgi:hypothetical protein
MFASLLSSLANLVIGLYTANKAVNSGTALAEQWFKFVASLIGSALVTFPGVWGAVIAADYKLGINVWVALVLGFAAALISTSAVLAVLWTRSPLTRGIPICWPMSVSEEILRGGFNITIPAESTVGKK